VGTTRKRRPSTPTAAERARSTAARSGPAALVGTGCGGPVVPLVHHVQADGSATLLLADGEPALDRIRGAARAELPAMLELTDPAPVDLREPVRGLLWITGWLRLPDPASARRAALHVADVAPHPALLDLDHGATLVRLHPNTAVLADAEGSASLTPLELAAARPDPFHRLEQHWLGHLEQAHPEVLRALSRHLPPGLRAAPGARLRPLGVDRCGLRLRVEAPDGDHDVRLAWDGGARTPEELREQLGRLVGCPFRPPGARAQAEGA
jgi:hypothetical protein